MRNMIDHNFIGGLVMVTLIGLVIVFCTPTQQQVMAEAVPSKVRVEVTILVDGSISGSPAVYEIKDNMLNRVYLVAKYGESMTLLEAHNANYVNSCKAGW